tara:strand:- start:838 stop:1761 length:924 start_codon:yes stop_codon:yes gene_type:complete
MGAPYSSKNLIDFFKTFTTEEICEKYLMEVRWPEGMPCLQCGKKNFYPRLKKRRAYQCKECRFFNRPTAGTLFHRTHTPLQHWFVALFLVSFDKRGISALFLSKAIGVHYETAWAMLSRIRRAMAKRESLYQLQDYVEVDEMFIGAPSENTKRGRGTDKTPVLVAVSYTPLENQEEIPGFAKLRAVDNVTEDIVLKFIKSHVEVGAIIRTDGLSVYPAIEKHGFKHDREPVKKRKAHHVLPHVHTFISNLRSFVQGTYHGLSEIHLQQYLDEFSYRFNRRHRRDEMFDRLLRACLETTEMPFSALTR